MMYATEDQLGQRIVCPDCDLPAIVRRPVEGPPKKPPQPTSDASEYALTEKVDRKAGEREALDSAYVAALCPVCHTRLHATLDQVGGKLICPDCGTPTVIPPPPPPPRKLDSPAEVVAGYGLSGWGDLSPVQTEPHSRPPSSADDEPRIPATTERHFEMPTRAERCLETSVRASLPRWPFLSGTFTFPVSRGARAFAFVLAAWAMLCVKLWAESIRLAALGSNEAWLGSILLGSAAFGLTR